MRRARGRLSISAWIVPALLLTPAESKPAESPEDLVARGQAELRTGRFSAALITCDRAIRLNVDFAPAYLCQAQAYEGLGQPETAAQSLGQALQLDSGLIEARKLRARFGAGAGKTKEALADWDILESSGAVPPADRLRYGRMLTEAGRHEDSVKSLSVCLHGAAPRRPLFCFAPPRIAR